jgi:TPR repeat protein
VTLIEQSALEGHPEAMLELGKAYYFGTIVKGDKELAKKWLREAKDRGSKEAGELLTKIEA